MLKYSEMKWDTKITSSHDCTSGTVTGTVKEEIQRCVCMCGSVSLLSEGDHTVGWQHVSQQCLRLMLNLFLLHVWTHQPIQHTFSLSLSHSLSNCLTPSLSFTLPLLSSRPLIPSCVAFTHTFLIKFWEVFGETPKCNIFPINPDLT